MSLPNKPLHPLWATLDRGLWYLMVLMAFSIPLSIKFYFVGLDLEVIAPAEILAGAVAICVVVAGIPFVQRVNWDRAIWRHPVTILLCVDLAISFFSLLGSNDTMVSLKWMIVRSVYLIAFFFVPLYFATHSPNKVRHLLLMHAIAVLCVVGWTFRLGLEHGFERAVSNYSCTPFYNDHTMYSAALVFVLFTALLFIYQYLLKGKKPVVLVFFVLSFIVLLALVASFGRGAWLSVVVAIGIGGLVLLGTRPVYWITGLLALILAGFILWQPLQQRSIANMGDADADNAGITEILWSYFNVTTDASNRERLVRWSTAIDIFLKDPVLGCGPGMYKFEYPAHNDPNKAIYSTEPPNTNVISARWRPIKNIVVRENPQIMYVDPGTAHSEYLLALSERGVPALAVFLSLMLLVLIRTVQMCRTFDRMAPKVEVLLISLPILAFGVHAIFNNFLDDCKIAFPFYAFVALFVQMDHTHKGANGRPPIKRPTDSGNVAH